MCFMVGRGGAYPAAGDGPGRRAGSSRIYKPWPKVLRMAQVLIFTKSAASVFMMQFAFTPECHEERSDELQLIAKPLFAMTINPKNISTAFQLGHKKSSGHHVTGESAGESADEVKAGDLSVMLIELE